MDRLLLRTYKKGRKIYDSRSKVGGKEKGREMEDNLRKRKITGKEREEK